MLNENGGIYSKAADWQPHLIVDGNLITGQNPASAQGGGRGRPARTSRHVLLALARRSNASGGSSQVSDFRQGRLSAIMKARAPEPVVR